MQIGIQLNRLEGRKVGRLKGGFTSRKLDIKAQRGRWVGKWEVMQIDNKEGRKEDWKVGKKVGRKEVGRW